MSEPSEPPLTARETVVGCGAVGLIVLGLLLSLPALGAIVSYASALSPWEYCKFAGSLMLGMTILATAVYLALGEEPQAE